MPSHLKNIHISKCLQFVSFISHCGLQSIVRDLQEHDWAIKLTTDVFASLLTGDEPFSHFPACHHLCDAPRMSRPRGLKLTKDSRDER